MLIGLSGGEYEATPENATIFEGNTLINGLYIDLDDDYLYIPNEPDYIPKYAEVRKQAVAEGIPVYKLDSYDPEAAPFCFIINAMCRLFRDEVDCLPTE